MNILLPIKCPYCRTGLLYRLDRDIAVLPAYEWATFTCDIEEGGCDRAFTVGIELTPVVSAFTLVPPESIRNP